MSKKLRVGIAGFGLVGKRRFEVIKTHKQLSTVAVCDRNFITQALPNAKKNALPHQDDQLSENIKYFNDYRELLQENLDLLFVCLTNDIAAEATIAGLEAGLHVFCEKPPGRNLDEVRQVIECKKKAPEPEAEIWF